MKRNVLGNNFCRVRRELGLSQERCAQPASVDHTYVGGIERGERNVSVDNIQRTIIGVGVDASKL